ncbi:hypothetical protein [uncultured Roseobacter sp.]|uniref:hypothetical protein n=1 Tax=uncultured Roseobacter sp. TaxID=114847 RepID=UPI00260CC004|nr:hypothetical protein [uncultured Roseobacter sp.]
MKSPDDIEQMAQALKDAMQKHLGVKGRNLRHAVRKAGRRLPKKLRAPARLMAQAEAVSGNLKLLRQLDTSKIESAYADLSAHLSAIDRAAERRARILSVLAVIAFNLIIVFAAWVIWLKARGSI